MGNGERAHYEDVDVSANVREDRPREWVTRARRNPCERASVGTATLANVGRSRAILLSVDTQLSAASERHATDSRSTRMPVRSIRRRGTR